MRHAVIVLLAVCCFGVSSYSQPLDELIAKTLRPEREEKMKAIKTMRIAGSLKVAADLRRRWARE